MASELPGRLSPTSGAGSAGAPTRRYRKSRRAEQEAQTRERITEAAVRLHGTVGPARTTVSGIAREAGVQRATVYRHFPDEESLFEACTSHYYARYPMPDLERWATIADPELRLRHGLGEVYAWYGRTEEMIERTSRDRVLVPAMGRPAERFAAYFEQARSALMRGRTERGRSRARVSAAIGHALGFPAWRSLVREQKLDDEEAVGLMATMIEAAALQGSRTRAGGDPRA